MVEPTMEGLVRTTGRAMPGKPFVDRAASLPGSGKVRSKIIGVALTSYVSPKKVPGSSPRSGWQMSGPGFIRGLSMTRPAEPA